MNAEDRDLARRLLRGDERAFEEFFRTHFHALFRFALSRMRNDADAAEEVAQATLCRAITRLHTYRGEATLFTWLCTFCRHEIAAWFGRRGRQPPAVSLLEDHPEVRAALESLDLGSPEAEARRSELARLVHVALDRLPARYASALEWKYIDGLSVNEIAGRLGLGGKAAESLLTRARQAFRESFAALTGGGAPGTGEFS